MSEAYVTLSKKEKAQILRVLSINENIQRESILLEKDIWICWALEFLFKMPNRLPMAFKGGTSLSKVFRIIDRFSEDVDITIDYQAFNCGDPFEIGISKTKLKNISLQLKTMVTQYLREVLIPYYEKSISEQFKDDAPTIELDNDGETLHLRYPSVVEQKSGYIVDTIRLEFGGRNLTTPSNVYTVTPDISDYVKNLVFPVAQVTVLSPQKTFWEKVTLMHYECNRPALRDDANRISRHWYDVAMLAVDDIGVKSINNRDLLEEVVKIKRTFYDTGYANYDDCLIGKFNLIPKTAYLNHLRHDFNKMLSNKMFYGEQPDFDSVISKIEQLQKQINFT